MGSAGIIFLYDLITSHSLVYVPQRLPLTFRPTASVLPEDVGGGVLSSGAQEEVTALAERIDGVIGCSMMGISALPTSHPRFLGMQGMHGRYASTKANWESDLIIGIGVRFSDRATGDQKAYVEGKKIIQIDPDFSEINKNIPVDAGLIGDIVSSVTRILKGVKKAEHPQWMARVDELKDEAKALRDHFEKTAKDPFTTIRIFDAIIKSAAGTPLPETSAITIARWSSSIRKKS